METIQEEAYRRLAGLYRVARREWSNSPKLREVARTMGLSERNYCDAYIIAYPITIYRTSNTSAFAIAQPLTRGDCDAAFLEAAMEGGDGNN